LLGQVALERLVQTLHLAECLGVIGTRVLEDHAEALELILEQDHGPGSMEHVGYAVPHSPLIP